MQILTYKKIYMKSNEISGMNSNLNDICKMWKRFGIGKDMLDENSEVIIE